MVLLKSEIKELKVLKRLIQGTPIKIKANDVGNVKISTPGFSTITTQLGSTHLSARRIVQARRSVIYKRKKKMQKHNYKRKRCKK